MKNIFDWLIFLSLFVFIFFALDKQESKNLQTTPQIFESNPYKIPVPIEFFNKKEDKKEFKKNREEWILTMHRSHPDEHWEEIDKNNRKINTDKIRY